jgi:hypothetical protein
MKQHEPFDPLAISLFRPQRIMLEPHHLAHLIQQFELRIGHQPLAGT